MAKKKNTVQLGTRVESHVIERIDAIIEDHRLLEDGVIWTRADVTRLALFKGLSQVEDDLHVAHGRVSPKKAV